MDVYEFQINNNNNNNNNKNIVRNMPNVSKKGTTANLWNCVFRNMLIFYYFGLSLFFEFII